MPEFAKRIDGPWELHIVCSQLNGISSATIISASETLPPTYARARKNERKMLGFHFVCLESTHAVGRIGDSRDTL